MLELINELLRLIGLDELVVSFDCSAPGLEIIETRDFLLDFHSLLLFFFALHHRKRPSVPSN